MPSATAARPESHAGMSGEGNRGRSMKILIVSDTHRRDGNLLEVIEKTAPFDMMIHLGDTEGSEAYFKDWIKNDLCVVHVVRGNNDFFSHTEAEKEISIGKYRAFLCHGHMYGVSLGTENIKEEARSRKVNVVMFGHTISPTWSIAPTGWWC